MPTKCKSIAASTSARCKRNSISGSSYCIFHIEKTPLFLAAVVGAVLSLGATEVYRVVVPSKESKQLDTARQEIAGVRTQNETAKLERANLEGQVSLLRVQLELAEAKATNERESHATQLGQIRSQLAPFVKLAEQRYPNTPADDALDRLRDELSSVTRDVRAAQQLSGIAVLGARGVSGIAGRGLTETTSISAALEGAWLERDEKLYPKCDEVSLAKFGRVIKLEPRFPFSYYALAECFKTMGNNEWLGHAERAMGLLEQTRKITPRHRHHDAVYRILLSYVEGKR